MSGIAVVAPHTAPNLDGRQQGQMIERLRKRGLNRLASIADVMTFGVLRRKAGSFLRRLDASSAAVLALQEHMRRFEGRHEALLGLSIPFVASQSLTQSDVLQFFHQFAPFDVDGHGKIRLGNANDGGYIFIDDFSEVAAVISCGISNDVTCDYAFAELGKTVVQFDHTVEGPPVPHRNFQFRKQAVDALGLISGSVKLWDVVGSIGDPSKADLLLKIDIDGDEWATFANFPIDALKRFRQISCEFHGSSRLGDPVCHSLFLRAIKNIGAAIFPAHLHANNFAGFTNVMGVAVPEVFEVTFVNRDLYRPSGRQCALRTELDGPNDPTAPDLFLGSPFLGG
jgi:hypothetical protein